MSSSLTPIPRFPRVPLGRRCAAFAIDFVAAWFLSILGAQLQLLFFILLWFGLRVVLVAKNQGQSLGRWALDMKVVDPKFRAIPGIAELAKREAITGVGAAAILFGLMNLNPANAWVILLPLPLGLDCALAFADPDQRQAFHDRIARTVIIQTRRGYSLDLKLKRLFAEVSRRVK